MKIGLCFCGGGSRGAYQVGASMALKEAGIWENIEAFSGTSIGAVNAALLASLDIEKVKNIWFNIPSESLSSNQKLFKRLLNEKSKILSDGIYKINQLEDTLKGHLDIERLRKQHVYVTLSLDPRNDNGVFKLFGSALKNYIKKNRPVEYSPLWLEDESHIYKQILASCSIPVVFSPTIIDGKRYYDGGLYDNVPVKPLIDEGCDTIIVIHLDKIPYLYKRRYPNIKFFALKPKHSLGWVLNFNTANSVKRYEQGYEEWKEFLSKNKIV